MILKSSRILWLLSASLGLVGAAHAWPSTSPSAKSAARLKYHPPDNWLEHYLPDDRYKIAGGIWKVVSTQYDTYYHRPDSQYMMRQPAKIVIGFASEQEAKEAGYRADGMYFSGPPGSQFSGGGTRVKIGSGRGALTVSGIRATLSDGSTILLPGGWTLRRGGLKTLGTGHMAFDMMMSGTDPSKMMMFMYFDGPGANGGSFSDPAAFKKRMSELGNGKLTLSGGGGLITNQFDSAGPNDWKIQTTRMSGMNGSLMRFKGGASSGTSGAAKGAALIMLGRGNKAFMFIVPDNVYGSPAGRAIMKTFKAS